MSNKLIESTIAFVERASRINGNLRSDVLKEEEEFPKKHVESGYKLLKKLHGPGFEELHSDARDHAIQTHAMKKFGYGEDKAENFTHYLNAKHADDTFPNKD
jgi:hypothetical protein